MQITTWGNRTCSDNGRLHDYAHKEWQGLLRDFYFVRWHTWLDALSKQMHALKCTNVSPDNSINRYASQNKHVKITTAKAPEVDWYAIEEPWTLRHNAYAAKPNGDPIATARLVMNFLIGRQ